ncbi:MAG: hypothetical protein GKR95_08980 [Gammaproteobacteria bacterium]|nr:hypothetical protein [Gammaproteobacteria bacterium]
MMHYLKILFIVALIPFIAGCSTTISSEDDLPHRITGILVVKAPETCPFTEGCGPKYSLLNENLDERIALRGVKLESLFTAQDHGMIFTVTGKHVELATSLVSISGYENVQSTLNVSGIQRRTHFSYLGFLTTNAASYTKTTFGCEIKWDKSYSWKETNGKITVSVVMEDTMSTKPRPYLKLTYDGESGTLLEVDSSSVPLSVCGGEQS